MRAIRSKDMKPEMAVRRLLHALGFRYRLHAKELPGKPDIVFRKRRKCIFVNGCFWHQHPSSSCADARLPKLARNTSRDEQNIEQLKAAGWAAAVIWECETKDRERLICRLQQFLNE